MTWHGDRLCMYDVYVCFCVVKKIIRDETNLVYVYVYMCYVYIYIYIYVFGDRLCMYDIYVYISVLIKT